MLDVKLISKPTYQVSKEDVLKEYWETRRDMLIDTLPSKEAIADFLMNDTADIYAPFNDVLADEFGVMFHPSLDVEEIINEMIYFLPSIEALFDDSPIGFYLIVRDEENGTIKSVIFDSNDISY